ncbi:Protein of unknown function [Bacillus cytotoxicus]|uniref:Uncharacterized protein n=1 Tax=Bacillus cytotoxicus TaxID=580165 RepID=A0AAX2CDE2_9BACI|nr:Protein of unknown function [Bacillus cytotoxicus]
MYLSYVKDCKSQEVLAYHVPSFFQIEVVYQTLEKLKWRLMDTIHPEALLHSEQFVHCLVNAKEIFIISDKLPFTH